MIRTHILILSFSLSLSVLAIDNCRATYLTEFNSPHDIAAAILAEAKGSSSTASRLIQSPRFSKIILAEIKKDPEYLKKLKALINSAKPIPSDLVETQTEIRVETPTDFTAPLPTEENRTKVEVVRMYVKPLENTAKIPLRLGEFSRIEEPGDKYKGYLFEMPDGQILDINPFSSEVRYLTPSVDTSGKIEYQEYRKLPIQIPLFLNKPRLVNSDLIVAIAFSSDKQASQLVFIDPYNPAQNISYGNLNGFIGNSVEPISSTEFLVAGSKGFVIYTRAQNGKPESVSSIYAILKNPNSNGGANLSAAEVLTNGDIVIATNYSPDYIADVGPLTEYSKIQHWIRRTNGTYDAGKEFSVETFTHKNQRDFMTSARMTSLNSIKLFPNSTIVTADHLYIKTWKWNQATGDLVLVSSFSPFSSTSYGWIKGIERLADGQVLVNTTRGNEHHPIFSIDSASKLTLTTNLPSAAQNFASGSDVTPLSHGGMISRGGMGNVWLWTRKP